MKISIVYTPAAPLQDRLFQRDLYNAMARVPAPKVLLYPSPDGSLSGLRFLGKRLGANLSENMVLNNDFLGDQRRLLSYDTQGDVQLRLPLLHEHLRAVDCLVLGLSLMDTDGVAVLPRDLRQVLAAFCHQADVAHRFLLPLNPLSPLAARQHMVDDAASLEQLQQAYPEEAEVLGLAAWLRPCVVCGPAAV